MIDAATAAKLLPRHEKDPHAPSRVFAPFHRMVAGNSAQGTRRSGQRDLRSHVWHFGGSDDPGAVAQPDDQFRFVPLREDLPAKKGRVLDAISD